MDEKLIDINTLFYQIKIFKIKKPIHDQSQKACLKIRLKIEKK